MDSIEPATYGKHSLEASACGLSVVQASFRPNLQVPDHRHEGMGIMALLGGTFFGSTPRGSVKLRPFTIVMDRDCDVTDIGIGPQGMTALFFSCDSTWCESYGLEFEGDVALSRDPQAALALLRLVALLKHGRPVEASDQAHEVIQHLAKRSGIVSERRPSWMRCAEEMLRERFRESVSLRDLAAELSLHPTYLARAFRACHGCSVADYIHSLRAAEAMRLVMSGRMSVGEAAHHAGFADHAHCTRIVARKLGVPPRALAS